ncbi:cathepsin b [Stylonychia lemnae]|uniref:Cathepsin b n=1 Tax=Stylonychia lemnae TaxID=5949 RepID=A0A078B742_STYLE|nr:cathepsin b [Stylonychia lemnae]|eukprot:CDW90335.1 cathepsin b [Stylonychia lemnae]
MSNQKVIDRDTHPINHQVVENIKKSNVNWKPFEVEDNPFKDLDPAEFNMKFGLLGIEKKDLQSNLKNLAFKHLKGFFDTLTGGKSESYHHEHENENKLRLKATLPTSFDWRTQMAACTHPVKDQNRCGSCWAFAATGFLQDRFCIQSGGSVIVDLSSQDMVSCDFSNSGCSGGWLSSSVNYLINHGVVSHECLSYSSTAGQTTSCKYRCDDKSTPYKKYGCRFNSMKILIDSEDIKQDLMTNGPSMFAFLIYSDFTSYNTGIYEVSNSAYVRGAHAVQVLGWDYDNGRLYWIAQNQWDTTWGEAGYFKIYDGQAGFGKTAISCMPDFD